MEYCMIIIVLGFPKLCRCFWPASYRVGFRDQKTFVISAGEDVNDEDDEDNENEMIQPEDLVDVAPLVNDEDRYKPLHSHVEHYNRRAARSDFQLAKSRSDFQIEIEETNDFDDETPFIAGFKHELDEYNFLQLAETATPSSPKDPTITSSEIHIGVTPHEIIKRSIENNPAPWSSILTKNRTTMKDKKNIFDTTTSPEVDNSKSTGSKKYSSFEKNDDLEITKFPENPEASKIESESQQPEEYDESNTSIAFEHPEESDDKIDKQKRFLRSEETTLKSENNEIYEEAYDYENFRAEYDQQLTEARNNNLTFNYTDKGEPEEGAGDAIKKIVEFDVPKNCTKEELTQFGLKALECLAFDYQHSRNETDVRRVFARTWTVIRVWVCIYVCIAVPCWFQKGWCCCCFRCSMCFPHDVILESKRYYSHNPPGVLMDQPKTNQSPESSPINYKPTLFELDAYEDFESAIRNL